MSRVYTLLMNPLLAVVLSSCASQSPRVYSFDDTEVFAAPYEKVWSIVDEMSKQKEWRIEKSNLGENRSYITTDWMSDNRNGGDYGSVGISLGKGNKPQNDKTKEVAISIRVVAETGSTTRVKITCLFRVQTSQGQSRESQTMFGTSKGIVEEEILDTVRSRLVLSN